MTAKSHEGAATGVVENGNAAILVTIGADHALLDRREITLTEGLPTHPYHHEGSWAIGRYRNSPWARDISLLEAIKLVEQVKQAADEGAATALEALARAIPTPITYISLRECPELPATIEERIRDNRAQTYADTVMYRQALAQAAGAKGWAVHWYAKDQVPKAASVALKGKDGDVKAWLARIGKEVGPPWQAKHKLAAMAALSCNAKPFSI